MFMFLPLGLPAILERLRKKWRRIKTTRNRVNHTFVQDWYRLRSCSFNVAVWRRLPSGVRFVPPLCVATGFFCVAFDVCNILQRFGYIISVVILCCFCLFINFSDVV